jgi:mRNA interferase MazF
MNVKRGEVVIVDWPLFRRNRSQGKPRPALVVQHDRDNARMTNTILAMITSVTRRSLEPTQLLIEITTPDGQKTGLRQDSVINCSNLLTVEQTKILATIGTLSQRLIRQIDDCLKSALDIP